MMGALLSLGLRQIHLDAKLEAIGGLAARVERCRWGTQMVRTPGFPAFKQG